MNKERLNYCCAGTYIVETCAKYSCQRYVEPADYLVQPKLINTFFLINPNSIKEIRLTEHFQTLT